MRRLSFWILIVAAVAEVLIAGIPVWVIRPFVAQPPRALALAMALRDAGGWATLLALAVIVVCAAVVLWPPREPRSGAAEGARPRRWARVTVAVAALVAGGVATGIAHVDYFQWMFHPDHDVRAIPIARAHWPARAMVLDVHLGGQARAYPIREMGYYHVVNDRLGGAPIAATY